MPLEEVLNQARPGRRRPGVYGKRRPNATESRELHRQLFGTDENDIEQSLQKLSLHGSSHARPGLNKRPQRCEQNLENIYPNSSKPSLLRVEEQHLRAAQRGKPSAPIRRPRENQARTKKLETLSTWEREAMAPVLSLRGVHRRVQNFTDFINDLLLEFQVTKAHEGTFSECFILTRTDDPTTCSVFKIIPFDLREDSNEDEQRTESSCSDIPPEKICTNVSSLMREFRILRTLESQHGFAQVRSMRIVRGEWHPQLLQAYDEFKVSNPTRAINSPPNLRWSKDQTYGVVEMVSAGNDLDTLTRPSAYQAYDAFWMTISYLAMAEQKLQFEHRDMHLSNLCYKIPDAASSSSSSSSPTTSALSSFDSTTSSSSSDTSSLPSPLLGRSGLEITVIDYNLSRMQLPNNEDNSEILSTIPENHGETDTEFSQAWAGNMQHDWIMNHFDGDWTAFAPRTNVFWLIHLLDEMLKRGRDETGEWRVSASAVETTVWERLSTVKSCLGTMKVQEMPESAQMVWELGLEKGWITMEDELALKRRLNGEEVG